MNVKSCLFDSYPYLATEMLPGFVHFALLPRLEAESLSFLGEQQFEANRLRTWVAHEEGVFELFDEGVRAKFVEGPAARTAASGMLLTVRDFAIEEWRQDRLSAFIDALSAGGGFLVANGRSHERLATEEEIRTLNFIAESGLPAGLERCSVCHEGFGACLDDLEDPQPYIVRVYCRCQNHNRCVRCGGTLADRRLNAFEFNPRDGKLWYTPGFCGLSHNCPATKS